MNRYFNDVIRYADDEVAWGVSDYWATLEQTLTKGSGDCDDIAIAKFLTLLVLGVSRANLRLAVVKTKQMQRNHMVVIYLPASEKNTYLLDNLKRELRVAPGAGAMHVVYSLDGRSLWMNDSRGKERRIGDASILAQWRGLLARISRPDLWRFYLA